MSLLDQSQQWFPTSVVVTVHQARNLRIKGKNGTNDAYAIIQVAKDKFSTSVAEKCVAPVWKEEASFDLPLFHPGNVERCTLYVTVMHRAQVGLDKFLGQGVVNLLDLHDNKSSMKTDWYKMVDKSGKEDKVRGEVLLDIQFMRNNMSASMFDLSMQDKPRSRISKLKDKVRGKKKDGASDSVSAIVPHVSQVLTDSEGEADAQSLNQATGEKKKKSKVKNLFAPKSNLQRNMSQSMSTLPEKNSSLSSSRSSGLNVDSSEGKKKFKLLGHKRTGSSDSKVSLGAFSLLGRSKQNNSEQNNLCINGSHVYTEEAEAKTGSSLSLNSSGLGSVEDVHKHTSDTSADVNRSAPVPSHSNDPADKALLEQQRHQQEENRRQMEEKRLAEAKRLEEEKYRAEAKRLQEEEQRRQQEEQERRRRYLEDEANRKKQEEEERRNEEERRRVEAAESQKLEEERRKAEEQKRQEEASMSDRLSSLFGMIKKKEEKKDEVHPPAETHHTEPKSPDIPVSHHSTNPFEDVPLPSDPPPVSTESPSDPIKFSRNQQTPSGMVHLNRTAKVSAVKPRLPQIVECEAADSPSLGQQCPTPAQSESTLSSVPSDSPDTVSSSQSSSVLPGSLCGNAEVLSFVESEGSSPTMGDPRKRSALQPPSYSMHRKQPAENPAREFRNPGYEDDDGSQQNKVSLPDYNMLFPQKRHGVQGQTRWDNLVTEFNKRHRDDIPKLMGPEMSVDEPEEQPSPRSKVTQENPIIRKHRETKPASSKKVAAPAPPKNVASQMLTSGKVTPDSLLRSISPAVQSSGKTSTSSGKSKDASTPRPPSRVAAETTPTGDERKPQVATNKEAPTAKPRQRVSASEPAKREESGAKTSIQAMSSLNTSSMNKQEKVNFSQSDQDSRPQLKHEEENNVSGDVHGEQTPEKRGGDVDKTDNLSENVNRKDSDIQTESRKKDEHSNPGFQRKNSSRRKILLSSIRSEKMFTAQQEAVSEELAALPTANPVVSARAVSKASVPPQPESHWTPESSSYGEEEPFPAAASSLPLSVVLEEPATQADHLSEGKPHLKAWVPPSGVQSVSSGVGLSPRRPHPVKPLNAAVNQTSPPAVKQIKVWDTTLGKNKLEESAESGPYSQLTSEELIKLVVKQQTDLSKKEAKITELEEYIDNLLVRVIEEKPTILNALNIAKPV